MTLQGSLDTIGLEEVFRLFALGRKSGVLRLRRPADAESGRGSEFAYVVFDVGDVVFATDTPGDDPFAAMVRRHVATDDSGAVEAFLRDRTEEAVCGLLQWDAGDFFVDGGDDTTAALSAQPYRFPTDAVLAAATERLERWKEILAVVPSTDLALRPVTRPVGSDDPVVLDRDEWSVLATAFTVPDIEAVAVALGLPTFQVCAVVRSLVERGLVQLARPDVTAVRPEPLAPTAPTEPSPEAAPATDEPVDTPVVQFELTPPTTADAHDEPAAAQFVVPQPQTEPEFESPVTFEVPTRTAAAQGGAAPVDAGGSDANGSGADGSGADGSDAGADGADGFDKSTILRLIAGVREN